MGDETSISWAEATWNPWRGCTRVSAGCDGCYMFRDQRRYGRDPEVVVRAAPGTFNAPLSKKWAEPRIVFTCSWSDWFHVTADPWRDEAWDIIRRTPQHTYMILTKRPGRIHRCLPDDWGDGWPNVWLGVSIETARFNHRADQLRRTPAALRFLSCEPLLGSLYPRPLASTSGARPDRSADDAAGGGRPTREPSPLDLSGIGLVIVGGESGPRKPSAGSDIPPARPMHPAWARQIRDAVLSQQHVLDDGLGDDVHYGPRPAFHFKQWGAYAEDQFGRDPNAVWVCTDGSVETPLSIDAYGLGEELNGAVRMRYTGGGPDAGGHVLDGRTWREMPETHAA